MPVDFLLAVKACLAAGYGQWNLPPSHFESSYKPARVKLITFSAYSSPTIVNCAMVVQIQIQNDKMTKKI